MVNQPVRRMAAACLGLLTIATAGCGGSDHAPRPTPSGPTSAPGQTGTIDFDASTTPPTGAEAFSGTWQIRPEPDAPSPPNVLCQTATDTFPAIALTAENYTDATVKVRFKAIAGAEDRAAGIIFRIADRDNYYILRANALEGNVNLYSYLGGTRTTLAEGSATVESGRWHELRVEFAGDAMTGYLDGNRVVQASNHTLTSGRIGLWTKADSTTCFDDLTIAAR